MRVTIPLLLLAACVIAAVSMRIREQVTCAKYTAIATPFVRMVGELVKGIVE